MQIYQVSVKKVWLFLIYTILIELGVALIAGLLANFVAADFSLHFGTGTASLSERVTTIVFLLMAIFLLSFLLAHSMLFYKVTIRDGILYGRNYWLRERSFPLEDIVDVRIKKYDFWGDCVIKSIDGKKICFPDIIENFSELRTTLEYYKPIGRKRLYLRLGGLPKKDPPQPRVKRRKKMKE